jgi:hypothetical protein
MFKFLGVLILSLILFAFSGCDKPVGQKAQVIDPSETVLITKKGTYKDEGTSITLYMSPCVNEKVKSLLKNDPEMIQMAAAAKGHVNGKDYAGCYLVDFNEGMVYFLDETGQGGRIPIDQFEAAPKV